jgi:hypothetical protein
MTEGQTDWLIWHHPPPMFTAEPQGWWCRWIYASLMWLSYRAESFWHWTYYRAQLFGPVTRIVTVEPQLYGYVGRDGVLRESPLEHADE